MSTSPRERVKQVIEFYVPDAADWRIVAETVKSVGTLNKPTVFIDYLTIRPLTETPDDLIDGFEIAVVSERQDYGAAEAALDDHVRDFVRALDHASDISWTTADKRVIGDYLAWIIAVQLITPREQ